MSSIQNNKMHVIIHHSNIQRGMGYRKRLDIDGLMKFLHSIKGDLSFGELYVGGSFNKSSKQYKIGQNKLYQDRNFTVIIDIPSGEKETDVVDVIAKKILNCGAKYPSDKIIVLSCNNKFNSPNGLTIRSSVNTLKLNGIEVEQWTWNSGEYSLEPYRNLLESK